MTVAMLHVEVKLFPKALSRFSKISRLRLDTRFFVRSSFFVRLAKNIRAWNLIAWRIFFPLIIGLNLSEYDPERKPETLNKPHFILENLIQGMKNFLGFPVPPDVNFTFNDSATLV